MNITFVDDSRHYAIQPLGGGGGGRIDNDTLLEKALEASLSGYHALETRWALLIGSEF